MTLKSLLTQSRRSTLVKLYLRLIPTLLGLSVISAFLIAEPQLAQELTTQLLTRLGIKKVVEEPINLDLIAPINDQRIKSNLEPLTQNDKLDQIARLATLSIADDPENEDAVNLKQLASISGYQYQTIAYLAAINPLPLVIPPTQAWITDSKDDLLSTEYTQIGSHFLELKLDNQNQLITVIVLAKPSSGTAPTQTIRPTYYTGTQLWAEIQKYRVEHGVPQFKQDNTLCTIASIRVNQLVELGRLDNHDGFAPLVDEYRDNGQLKHTNVAENILSGYLTPQDAVAGWDGSLGHQALMRDGSYVFGCAAANYGYAVLIAAF